MRFLITAAPDPNAPKPDGEAPFDPDLMRRYMAYNETLHRAGVLVASEGLNPARKGARVGNVGGKRVVLDGPFAETRELVGGFYILEVASLEEATAWALQCPTGFGSDDVLTIHPMTGADDLPEEIRALIAAAAPEWSASWTKDHQTPPKT